jgi:hypothetical protein
VNAIPLLSERRDFPFLDFHLADPRVLLQKGSFNENENVQMRNGKAVLLVREGLALNDNQECTTYFWYFTDLYSVARLDRWPFARLTNRLSKRAPV